MAEGQKEDQPGTRRRRAKPFSQELNYRRVNTSVWYAGTYERDAPNLAETQRRQQRFMVHTEIGAKRSSDEQSSVIGLGKVLNGEGRGGSNDALNLLSSHSLSAAVWAFAKADQLAAVRVGVSIFK